MILEVREDIAAAWRGRDIFEWVRTLPGEVYRDKEGRRTLRFELDGRGYFLKLHQGVGWWEIAKNLLQGRLPVLGASNEYQAIRALERQGIDTLTIAGYGRRGWNPARQLSFLITDELTGTESLEDIGVRWLQVPPSAADKRQLILRVAEIARRMHMAGINHRDFYLCHFLLESQGDMTPRPLYLMDLHRAQIRRRVPRRWLVKDLGALYYSALDIGLSQRDILRFVRTYRGGRLPRGGEWRLWHAARQRAGRIYRRDHGVAPASVAWHVRDTAG